ncbi:MAG: indolepyruvate ferredoxin oxidoreductase subunit alpha [Armatimonadetes bacterium]|nr:indolepyruvate ferredoxin oxidoreductase subunit alpha [Armatimonadota bacterium]
MKTTRLLSGNEAIARGAHEAGVRVAAGYPGTPSTEILENIIQYPGVYAEWSPNEKVALEVALGAAYGGARALATMKHVGLNVASDPLLTASYTGVNAGLVIVNADDPGMHSSQNEQDNRHYARLAKVPMLEPADSQEAKDFTIRAFALSEEFDTPVLLRTTTRVNHGKSVVCPGERAEAPPRRFERNLQKYVMVPANAMRRHAVVEERLARLRELADATDLNRVERGDRPLGVITAGASYQYVKEVLPEAWVLKLGLIYPLPEALIREFAARVETLYVVEELDPFLEEQVRALGIPVLGKERFPRLGELNPGLVAAGFAGPRRETAVPPPATDVPARPPVLCPGCPHRGFYQALRKLRAIVTGDIGCYSLGALSPLETMDTCVCMGASVGNAIGIRRAQPPDDKRPVVAVIGDSTFVHSGITGLVDAVYNNTPVTVCILDNRTTAMTGGQDHPASGRTLAGAEAPRLDMAGLARAVGVEDVLEVDPYDQEAAERALRYAVQTGKPSVVITNRPCVLIDRSAHRPALAVDLERCTACGLCFRLGCPAIEAVRGEDGKVKASIHSELCTGCDVCAQVCRFDAIAGEGA